MRLVDGVEGRDIFKVSNYDIPRGNGVREKLFLYLEVLHLISLKVFLLGQKKLNMRLA